MKQKQLVEQITEHLQACLDENLLDLILRLLVESSN